jgi:hypothetical protein
VVIWVLWAATLVLGAVLVHGTFGAYRGRRGTGGPILLLFVAFIVIMASRLIEGALEVVGMGLLPSHLIESALLVVALSLVLIAVHRTNV